MDAFPRNRATKDGRATYCKPCHNRIAREQRDRMPGGSKNYLLKLRYGVELYEVEWMKLQQDGKCAICGIRRAEHVDHDHALGTIRGLLCFKCNTGLGLFGDDIALIRESIAYLRSHGVKEASVPYLVNV